MTTDQLSTRITIQDSTQCVHCSGELTAFAGSALEACCQELLAVPECRAVVFDLSGLTYVNTAGIALFVAALNRLRRQKTVTAVGLSAHHQHLFRAVGLQQVLTTR